MSSPTSPTSRWSLPAPRSTQVARSGRSRAWRPPARSTPPVAGKIVEVNAEAAKDPSLVNSDPYGKGWLVKLEVADASAIMALPDGAAYDKKHGHW